MKALEDYIRSIPDYPQKGILFRDITTLLKDPEGLSLCITQLKEKLAGNYDKVVGIESRGFILGAILAHEWGVGFVPLRKKGKLPADVWSVDYELEYGTDTLELHKDALAKGEKILLVDDLLATGGTMLAGCKLIEKSGANVTEISVIIDLPDLGGGKLLTEKGYSWKTLTSFCGK